MYPVTDSTVADRIPNDIVFHVTKNEAFRAIAILEDAVEKISFLDCVPVDILAEDELSIKQPTDEIYEKRESLDLRHSNQGKKGTDGDLYSNTSRLSTNHSDASINFADNNAKLKRGRRDLVAALQSLINELTEENQLHSIVHFVTSDKSIQKRFADQIRQNEEAESLIKVLSKELDSRSKEHYRIVKEARATFIKEKESLSKLKASMKIDNEYQLERDNAMIIMMARANHSKEQTIEAKINDVTMQCNLERLAHSETMAFLDENRSDLASNLREWEMRYATDYESISQRHASILSYYNDLKLRLNVLKERRDIEKEENARTIKCREDAIRDKLMKKEIAKLNDRAARRIQRIFKMHHIFIEEEKKQISAKKALKSKKTKKK